MAGNESEPASEQASKVDSLGDLRANVGKGYQNQQGQRLGVTKSRSGYWITHAMKDRLLWPRIEERCVKTRQGRTADEGRPSSVTGEGWIQIS